MAYPNSPRYPAMERQDLTQGQLGSFKFTPVDVQLYNNMMGETPMLWQAQARLNDRLAQQSHVHKYSRNTKNSPSPSRRADYNMSNFASQQSPFGFPSQPQSPLANTDPGLFNAFTTSDMEYSQLRMGSVAPHSAESDCGLQRLHPNNVSSSFYRNILSTYLAYLPSQPSASYSPLPRSRIMHSTMNPEASIFDPLSSSSDSGRDMDGVDSFKARLCSELLAEQQAHEQTQMKLEVTQLQLQAMLKEHASTINVVKMLSGIIGNKDKEIERLNNQGKQENRLPVLNDIRNGRMPAINDFKTPTKTSSIKTGASINGTAQQPPPHFVKQVSPESDHATAFNLDLLKSQKSSDPQTAHLSRALRKHFSVDDDASTTSSESLQITVDKPEDPNELVHVSPQAPQKVTAIPSIESKVSTQGPTKEQPAIGSYQSTQLCTAENAVLQLPASFLSKYAAKKKGTMEAIQEQGETMMPKEPETVILPSNRGPAKAPMPVRVNATGPLQLHMKWKVTKENPIYDYEDGDAPKSRSGGSQTFWKYPVRFMNYGDKDKNIFRTVMIDDIPSDATKQDVLEQIHGGSLEKIELVPAVGRESAFQTARLVFNFELGASSTASFARDHGIKIKGQRVRVWQVITPTYPKNERLDRDVFDNAFTRILIISNATEEALSSVSAKLNHLKSSVVDSRLTHDEFPMMEFSSVAAATEALDILQNDPAFAGAMFDFDDDYCGEPYPFAY